MKAPATPENDSQRLRALQALNVLDTEPEERFDRLTRLAKRLFDVPIALVSLVDENRQWFKSKVGLEACETSRDISFCGHAILGDEIFVVTDASADSRFCDNPLVTHDPGIRFYAGVPLTAPCGSKLGTLCVIDREPHDMDVDDCDLLNDLAKIAEQELASLHLASMDDLTLLSNRRGFMALSQHAMNVCRRINRSAALFYFDLDQFKQINDQFGHAEGDRALETFAGLLKETFRDSDVLGRLGGDEFVVFLTGSELEESEVTLARLQVAIDAYNAGADRGYTLRYSVGAVQFDPNRHADVDDLMDEADRLMYKHKNGGAP